MSINYYSPRRASAAAATRTAILKSAQTLFLERGYSEVTVNDIAKASRVAVPTVYASTGGKAVILAALLQRALFDPGLTEALTPLEQTEDPRLVVALIANGARKAHERHWAILYGLLNKAPGESAVDEVLKAGSTAYLEALTDIAERLRFLDSLKPELDSAEVLDLLWFYVGRPAWFTLVGEREWTFDHAEAWLTAQARQALLRDPDPRPRRSSS